MCNCPRNPHQCIVPPYMLKKVMDATEGKNAQFKAAVQTVVVDARLRSQRKAFLRLSDEGQKVMAIAPLKRSSTKATVKREVYSARHKEVQPGKLVRKEGQGAVRDKDVNNVYDAAGYTWDFYYSLFGRNSINNKGMKIVQTVNYSSKYNNAFWDGQQMVYGDGDGKIFGSFTSDVDIIGHELTHGVVQYEANLVYLDQSGALNESLSDVFGALIKQKALNQDVMAASWLIGENVLRGKKYAIRSMKAPGMGYRNHPQLGNDPQPAHMENYTNDPFDNGGVHLNSGIPNHAFYLAAHEIGGFAWEKTGRVWYAAMCDKKLVKPDATFADFKNATLVHAQKLFKKEKSIELAIANAWTAVGV